jgi:hypothetical protein
MKIEPLGGGSEEGLSFPPGCPKSRRPDLDWTLLTIKDLPHLEAIFFTLAHP